MLAETLGKNKWAHLKNLFPEILVLLTLKAGQKHPTAGVETVPGNTLDTKHHRLSELQKLKQKTHQLQESGRTNNVRLDKLLTQVHDMFNPAPGVWSSTPKSLLRPTRVISPLSSSCDKPTTAVSGSPSPTSRCVESKFIPRKRFPCWSRTPSTAPGQLCIEMRSELWRKRHGQFRNESCGFAGQRFRERRRPLSRLRKRWEVWDGSLLYSLWKSLLAFPGLLTCLWSSKLSYSCLNGIFSLCFWNEPVYRSSAISRLFFFSKIGNWKELKGFWFSLDFAISCEHSLNLGYAEKYLFEYEPVCRPLVEYIFKAVIWLSVML